MSKLRIYLCKIHTVITETLTVDHSIKLYPTPSPFPPPPPMDDLIPTGRFFRIMLIPRGHFFFRTIFPTLGYMLKGLLLYPTIDYPSPTGKILTKAHPYGACR